MKTVYIAYQTLPPVSITSSASSRSSSSIRQSSSSYSCTLFPKKNNFYNIELYGSGTAPTGYTTEHKLIIYKNLGSGVHSGMYETPYLPYSGIITSITTELPEDVKFEVKTIYKDKNIYIKDGDYLDVQILNLIDVNYSNRIGIDLFKKEAINSFNELFCCTDKCYIGFVKFAGKNQVEKFDFSNNKQQVYAYISGLSGVYKYNPGSAINEALDLAQTFTWKKEALKIINFITNNKPYIERTSYECYKSDIDFPSFSVSEIDDIFLKFNLIKNNNKDTKLNVFFIDDIGIETKNFSPIISSSSRAGGGGASSSSKSLAPPPLPSLFISSISSSSDGPCPCDVNITKTIFECDPCCGIKNAYEDGYKHEILTDPNTLEKICCPPCPEGYYREDKFYDLADGCANCEPLLSSSSTSSSSKSTTSSSSKSWLIRSSSSSLSLIKGSGGSNNSFNSLAANCYPRSAEESCCFQYGKCGSSMTNMICSSESKCSCTLSSADCPDPCPCSINDYGITLNHRITVEQGTCSAGPDCLGWFFEIGMEDKKYTEEYIFDSNNNPNPNPSYLCKGYPLSNTVNLKKCKRPSTDCPSQQDSYSPIPEEPQMKVPCSVHPKVLGATNLTLNWVVLSLCDGRPLFNQIFQSSLIPCKGYYSQGKKFIGGGKFWVSVCTAYGAYGYKIKYWVTWQCGILNDEIKEFEVKFGQPIECTSANADYWSTWPDKKCCCSSSSTSSGSSGGSGGSSTGAIVGGQVLLNVNTLV